MMSNINFLDQNFPSQVFILGIFSVQFQFK